MASLTAVPDDAAPKAANVADLPAWRRWLIMLVLMTGGIKTTLVFTTVVPALQLIAAYFRGNGDSVLNAQLIVTTSSIGMAVAGLLAGSIVGLGGLRRTLNVSLLACAAAGLSQLFIEDFRTLLASRFLLGVAAVTSDVALTAILAAEFSGKTRSFIIGFRQAISSAGTAGTIIAGGWLAAHYGWRAPAWMFITPLAMLALTLLAFNRPITLVKRAADSERFSVWQLWPVLLLQLVMAVPHSMPSFQIPFLLKADGITDTMKVAMAPALSSLVSVLSAAAFGAVYSYLGRWTLVIASVVMGLGFVGAALAPNFEIIMLCVVAEGVGAGWTIPYFQNRMLDRVTPKQRGQAIGFVTTAYFLGQFVNPIVTAPIRQSFGIHWVFGGVGGALLAASILLAIWASTRGGREDATAT